MRNRLVVFLIAVLPINIIGVAVGQGSPSSSGARQQASPTDIDRLKQTINKLEAADKDPNIPDSARQLNQRYLQQLRSELETILNNELAGWRRYLETTIKGIGGAQEKEVRGKIAALEQDLNNLKAAPTLTNRTPRPRPAPPPESPRPEPGTEGAGGTTAGANTPSQNRDPQMPRPVSQTPTLERKLDVRDCTEFEKNPQAASLYEKYFCRLVNRVITRKTKGDTETFGDTVINKPPRADATIDNRDYFMIALTLIGKLDPPDYLVKAEESRTDKQVGAGPQAAGTTSLVVKGSAPTILGLAVENGALTQTTSGTTITFRGNPVGILQALANRGYLESYEESERNGSLRFLKPFSFSFSFDTSRGNDQTNTSPGSMPPPMPNVFTADRQQLSQLTARYEFINHRDPRHKKYREEWANFLEGEASALNDRVDTFFRTFFDEAGLKEWRDQTQQLLREASDADVERVLKSRFDLLSVNSLKPETIEIIKSLDQSFGRYLTARKNLLDRIAKGTIVALEYTNTRNVDSPNLSNFRLIAEKGPSGNVDATFNGSLTIFDKIPTGMSKRLRDFQFAGQIDYKAKNLFGSGDMIFFASGKYERLMENATDPSGMAVMNTKGDIGVAQVGIKIPIKGSGIRIPISFSYANRTELIKEKEIRGNIGFTFDLDALFSNAKP